MISSARVRAPARGVVRVFPAPSAGSFGVFVFALCLAFTVWGLPGAARAETLEWRILKDHWSEADERGYSDFVRRIGESDCNTVDSCMKSAANTYKESDPPRVFYYADCADFPYLLRAYYAWKNGLPFSYVDGVAPAGSGGDIRFTDDGNIAVSRFSVTHKPRETIDPIALIKRIRNTVSTATFRIHPQQTKGVPSDHYSPALTTDSIKPGTMIYDPNGHVAIVFRVDPDGRIHYVDAHPDSTVTRNVYGPHFYRGKPGLGAGFSNWRPIKLVGAVRDSRGALIGGRIEVAPRQDIEDYALTQFFGTQGGVDSANWQQARYVYNGEQLPFTEYLRSAMAGRNLVYDPIKEMTAMMSGLCQDLDYRREYVEQTLRAGIHRQQHPPRLPDNIYGTHGDWELYSSPARDARLKTTFKQLRDDVQRFVERHAVRDAKIAYDGDDLPGDLLRAYEETASACTITYTRSDGGAQPLSYHDVVTRLFDLSFDPYHCVELRWGAREPRELASCPDGADKLAWYAAQQNLRNQIERTYDAFMGYSLAELSQSGPGRGVQYPPDVDLYGYLLRLNGVPIAQSRLHQESIQLAAASAPAQKVTVADPQTAAVSLEEAAKPLNAALSTLTGLATWRERVLTGLLARSGEQ